MKAAEVYSEGEKITLEGERQKISLLVNLFCIHIENIFFYFLHSPVSMTPQK